MPSTESSSRDWIKPWGELYRGAYAAPAAQAEAAYAKPPASPTPALPLQAYAGRYANDFVGHAVVSGDSGVLTLTIGPDGKRSYPMRHYDRDLFLIFPDSETPDRPYPVRFAIGPDGKAARVTIDPLNGAGLGTLDRTAD